MPDIRPFRGIRYDMAQVGALSDVVAPPYDVIDPALQDRLYDASPYNVIRLELNREEAGRFRRVEPLHPRRPVPQGLAPRRASSARIRTRPLTSTTRPSRSRGRPTPARGSSPGSGSNRSARGKSTPTSRPSPGPKADRLALFNATSYNLSPIFGLYPDADDEVLRAAEAGIATGRRSEATDHLGVLNRLWPVTDPKTHTAVQGLMGPRPVFIADGHHRYETGVKFRDDLAAAGRAFRPRRPGQLLHDDARRHERPRPDHPADPPARLAASPA